MVTDDEIRQLLRFVKEKRLFTDLVEAIKNNSNYENIFSFSVNLKKICEKYRVITIDEFFNYTHTFKSWGFESDFYNDVHKEWKKYCISNKIGNNEKRDVE